MGPTASSSSRAGCAFESPNSDWWAPIRQQPCHGGNSQRFYLTSRDRFYYAVSSKSSGLCLDISNASTSVGAALIQFGCYLTNNQLFYLEQPFRSREERTVDTDPDHCVSSVQYNGVNCVYGYHAGLGWGSGSPKFYDEVDRCALWHDNGCWNVNLYSGANEGNFGCTQTVNFINCVERVIPSTYEEMMARTCILDSALKLGADICEPFGRGTFYPLYDARTTGGACATLVRYP